MQKVKVLFVCMGNICRSPTAEGVFTKKVKDRGLDEHFELDSAGTHAYHVGEPPDPRADKSAAKRGVSISHLRARKVNSEDFSEFDFVLAMDKHNYQILEELCPEDLQYRLSLFMNHAPHLDVAEVPDPYYGGSQGFERVLDLIEAASDGLLDLIEKEHLPHLKSR